MAQQGDNGARRVLFLQGPPSPLWRETAAAFEAAGHQTFRVNLSTADWLYWRRSGAHNYRGRLAGWRDWLATYLDTHQITDILYYADRLPYHRIAAALAKPRGIRANAVEFGYMRPDFLTLERDGMGAYSHFPNDPDAVRAIAARCPPPDLATRYPHTFRREAFNEVTFNLVNSLFALPYPFFDWNKYDHPILDYVSWGLRALRRAAHGRAAQDLMADIEAQRWPYHLIALQLQSDYQVRANSQYGSLNEMIEEVISSFARNAPPEMRLVFKLHPLDNGLRNWPKAIARAAAIHGAGDRALTIDGGDLDRMIDHASGVVAINSTVGLRAVRKGTPVKILGAAIFDMPGLTHQARLDDFWAAPEPVDRTLVAAFLRALAGTIQVKGSIYDASGRAVAAKDIVRRVAEGLVNEPGAYVDPPPRRAAMRKAARIQRP